MSNLLLKNVRPMGVGIVDIWRPIIEAVMNQPTCNLAVKNGNMIYKAQA